MSKLRVLAPWRLKVGLLPGGFQSDGSTREVLVPNAADTAGTGGQKS